jgi:hypothetical protein
VTPELAQSIMDEEAAKLVGGADDRRTSLVEAAQDVFRATCLTTDWPQFFTNYAYDHYLVAP